jgi:hypothetical protein
MGVLSLGATNAQRSTLGGRPCVAFDQPGVGDIKAVAKAVIYKNKVYTFSFAYKRGQNRDQDKFFDSILFN